MPNQVSYLALDVKLINFFCFVLEGAGHTSLHSGGAPGSSRDTIWDARDETPVGPSSGLRQVPYPLYYHSGAIVLNKTMANIVTIPNE